MFGPVWSFIVLVMNDVNYTAFRFNWPYLIPLGSTINPLENLTVHMNITHLL